MWLSSALIWDDVRLQADGFANIEQAVGADLHEHIKTKATTLKQVRVSRAGVLSESNVALAPSFQHLKRQV